MIETTIKAVLGITLVLGGWLSVQMAWQRVFANSIAGDGPVFDRCGGHSCCRSVCEKKATVDEEDRANQSEQSEQPTNHEG